MKKLFIFILLLLSSARVYAYDADGYRAKTEELNSLLSQCEDAGMECPYEEMQITVMEQFLDESVLSNTDYVAAHMDEIYTDTKAKLEEYIAGTSKPMQSPKYISSKTKISGTSLIGNTTWGERPVFFIGYGHFSAAVNAFSKFSSIGANISQQEIGPNSVIVEAKVPKWSFSRSSNEGLNCDITLNYDTNYTRGTASAKLEMTNNPKGGYAYISQTYKVEPNTTYNYSIQAIADSANCAFFKAGSHSENAYFDQSSIFKKYSGTFTTGSETEQYFAVYINNPGTVYIDNVTVTKQGTSENLLINGTFETPWAEVFGNNQEFAVDASYIENKLIPMLESAEKNNVAVTLLLSPHYFPGFVKKYYPDINMFDEQYMLIMDKYIEAVITRVKDYSSLHDICLTNEPTVNTAKYPGLLPDYQAWLEERFGGDLQALNTAYNSSYTDFSEIQMPPEATEIPEGSTENIPIGSQTRYFYDWMEYNNKKFAAWHKHLADKVREYMPDAKIHAKMQDYFDYNSNIDFARYRLTWGTEAEDFAEFSNIAGNDSATYYSWDGRHLEGQLKWYDYLSSVNGGPIFNSEDHIVEDYSTLYNENMAQFTRAVMFQGALHGRTGSAIWAWEQTSDSDSLFSGNVMQRPDFMTAIGKTTLDLNRLAYEVTALNKKEAKVAILYSNLERVYNKNYLTVLDQVYKAALYSGQKVRFVTDTNLSKVNDYEVLIVPNVSHISAGNLDIIKSFKNSGKKVVLLGECFTKDDFDKSISFSSSGYITDSAPNWQSDLTYWSDLVYNTLNDTTVRICDENGELVHGVEWSYTMYNGKVIVNVCNYSDTDLQNMKMYFNGELVEVTDLVSNKNLGRSFTAKGYEPMILEYAPQSFVKDIDYSDGTVKLTLFNPLSSEEYIKAQLKCYRDNSAACGGGISGDTKAGEEIHFNLSCGTGFDKIILQMLSSDGRVKEEWNVWEQ